MLDKDRLGAAFWNKVKNVGGPFTPAIGSAQNAQGLALWTAIAEELINEIKTNGVIDLSNGDVEILPGTFKDSLSAPITGKGTNNAVQLTGKIK